MEQPKPMSGRVALVTGASRNIGASIAIRLAQAGARVAVNYSSAASAADAADVVQRIRAEGGTAEAVWADVADGEAVAAMVESVASELGSIDAVVNNAAVSVASETPWSELATNDWAEVMKVNVTGGYLVLREIDRICGLDDAAVVNISSIRAFTGKPGNLHYTASKAAQIGATRALARELGPRGVRVNALLVGAIKTPAEAQYGPAERVDREVLAHQALQLRGEPHHVASATTFLLSDDAAFITGQSLAVDGGWILH